MRDGAHTLLYDSSYKCRYIVTHNIYILGVFTEKAYIKP